MKLQKLILIGALALTIIQVRAQQDPMYTQYMYNTLSVNPAYAGSRDALTILGLSRHQWVSMDGAPSTQTITVHTPFKDKSISAGFSLVNDKVGPTNQMGIYGDIAYSFRINRLDRFRLGLKGGTNIFRGNFAELPINDVGDPVFQQNVRGELLPNIGFGAFYQSPRYYAGVSIPKMLENDLNFGGGNTQRVAKERRHLFLIGGYVFDINDEVKFKPSVLTKLVSGAPASVDLTANFLLRDQLWLGVMHRIGDSFGFLTSYRFTEQLTGGYAFDLTTTDLRGYNFGTHEIMLMYDFEFIRHSIRSPRYF